jgi:hypothetical protein
MVETMGHQRKIMGGVRTIGWWLAAGLLGWGMVGCRPSVTQVLTVEAAFDDLLRFQPAAREGVRSEMISSTDPSGGNADWADLRSLHQGEDRYRLASLKGPGCLRRVWMTNVRAVEWLFYLDGESEPRLRLTESQLFGQEASAPVFPFEPPLADTLSGGAYSYVPIPFQRSLDVVVRISHVPADARPYFHFNVEFYPNHFRVSSYPKQWSAAQRRHVEGVLQTLRHRDDEWAAVRERLQFQPLTIPAGAEVAIVEREEPTTIRTWAVRLMEIPGEGPISRSRALRELVVRGFWEETQEPSVEVPLGDFFCNGLHLRRFTSAVVANEENVLVSRWPISWQRRGRLRLRNDGATARSVEVAAELDRKIETPVRYLHAAWAEARRGGQPFRLMRTEGKGEFAGCYLVALGSDGSWNILEGDERFYRDGELRPVHVGTGLEDYFNGGWYYYGLMERPFHGLLEKAAMRTAQYRFHIPDPITFDKSLQMMMEFGDGNRAQGYLSATTWWYQDRPGPAGTRLPPASQRFPHFDSVALAASLCELFELERCGLEAEAEARSAWLAEILDGTVWGRLYALRRLAYRERREGTEAIRPLYEAMAADETNEPDVREQASLLAWRAAAPRRALYGASGYAEIRLFMDGREIGPGGAPHEFRFYPVELGPGDHMLRAEVRPRGEFSWYTIALDSTWTTVVSDVTWDYTWERPEGWPADSGDPARWRPYAQAPWFLPNMQWWRFAPNAFPFIQSGRQIGGPESGWERRVDQVLYLQRRIHVPDEAPTRYSPPPRLREIRTPPLRPPTDTSNQRTSP